MFAHYDASASGWPAGWSFFVGLLQPAYVLTGYGMVAAMCEEVQAPEREVPKAIVRKYLAFISAFPCFVTKFMTPPTQLYLKSLP